MAASGAAPGNSAVGRGRALCLADGLGKQGPQKRSGSKVEGRDAGPGVPASAPARGRPKRRLRALLVRRRLLLLPRSSYPDAALGCRPGARLRERTSQPAPNLGANDSPLP